MKKIFLFLISACIGMAFAAGQGNDPAKTKELKIMGTIETYNNVDSTLILMLHNKKMDTLQLTSTTAVSQKGKAVPFTDLAAGDRVTAFYMKENGRNMAVKVEVWPSKVHKAMDTGMKKY